jgi:hypothetical protein
MRKACFTVLVLLILASCSGSEFIPLVGPFSGTLTTADGPVGQFTFTVTDRQLGGTGTLTLDSNLVPVSIIGPLTGELINGDMQNVNLGSGDFIGHFSSTTSASGTFTFVDSAQTINLSGTWTALAPHS